MTENDDVIWRAEEISRLIGKPLRQTFYLLERGYLPARKVGRQWVASRSRLLAYLAGDEPAEAKLTG